MKNNSFQGQKAEANKKLMKTKKTKKPGKAQNERFVKIANA